MDIRKTQLHYAVEGQNEKNVENILQGGANPYIYDSDNLTPYDYLEYKDINNEKIREMLELAIRRNFEFKPEVKEYSILYENETESVKLVEVLLDMHGEIDNQTIYLNTDKIIFGPTSINLCPLRTNFIPFDKIIPLNYYSRYSFIPDIYLQYDDTKDLNVKSSIQIDKYDILRKVFPNGQGRLSKLFDYLLDNFPSYRFLIKNISCLTSSSNIDNSYIKCYTPYILPEETNIDINKVIKINVNGKDELFYNNDNNNYFSPTKKLGDLTKSKLMYKDKEILKFIPNSNIFKTPGCIYVSNDIFKDLPFASVRNFDNIEESKRLSGDFTNKVTIPSIENSLKNVIDLSNSIFNEKFFREYINYLSDEENKIFTNLKFTILDSSIVCKIVLISKLINNQYIDTKNNEKIKEIINEINPKPKRPRLKFGRSRRRNKSSSKVLLKRTK